MRKWKVISTLSALVSRILLSQRLPSARLRATIQPEELLCLRSLLIVCCYGSGYGTASVSVVTPAIAASKRRSVRASVMSEVVLLRDFEDDVPKDLRISFCESLPREALCILCENVSARLYKDRKGHGYCRSCREMCKREDMFHCATCKDDFYVCELEQEPSIHDAIRKARVICPRSNPDEPVEIPFKALTAHLKNCPCNVVAAPLNRSSDSRSSGEQQGPIDPIDPQGENKGSKMAQCSYCKKAIPKKSVQQHMEDCRENLQMSSQHGETNFEPKQRKNSKTIARRDSCGDMSGDFSDDRDMPSFETDDDTVDAATKLKGGDTSYFNGTMEKTEKSAFPTDSIELSHQLADALDQIRDLKEEISELRQAAAKTKGDVDFLNVAVPTMQDDMRNVQIQCEQRISKSEKAISSLEESKKFLLETVSLLQEDTRKHLQAVQEMVQNMTEKLSLPVHDLQMQEDYCELVQNIFTPQEETKKGKKGSSSR
ncbi:uncharacterized protein LOC119164156 isoform X2 [Rhipicephalus microplus]|uniref:uncharacterized protein LOC119164156 isoform X2 n=1 Tax=Rhipicephalus microplus TaxID=6941 RepID=UPI003F6CD1DF